MKALTLYQPWAWCVAVAGKPVENRSWPAPRWLIGQRIAIHAGLKLDREAVDWMCFWLLAYKPGIDAQPFEGVPAIPETFVHGAVVATVRLARCRRLEDIPVAERTRWHVGPWCWELDAVEALDPPVPAKGQRGLWDLDERLVPSGTGHACIN